MTLGILDILILFVLFCMIWTGTNVFWKVLEGKILARRQDELMDRIYSKAIRLCLQFIQDFKSLKEVAGRDKM